MTLYQELAEYTGRPLELVTQRCLTAPIELAWQWERYRDDPLRFYRESDLYIFDLTMYQTLQYERKFYDWYTRMIRTYGWRTMLDYGGGIGEYTIVAANERVTPVFLEVAGSRTLDYALWRFGRRGLGGIEVWDENTELAGSTFDFVVIMDVLEHLEEPAPLVAELAQCARFIIVNPGEVPYNCIYPQHISRYSLNPHFEHVERYLWRSVVC